MEQYEVSDTDSVVGELHEVAMVGDLDVAEDFELGPDDVPPTDDESELGDESIRGSDEDMEPEFDAAEAGEASGLQTIDEPVDDLSVQQLTAHTSAVFAVAVNAAQPHLFATGGGDDVGYLWRLGGAEPVARLQGHSETISSMAFSSDGAYLATGGLDGIVRVWAADTGAPVVALEGPTQGINWVCWHVRGAVLLAGSEDATAWMWKVPEGSVMQIFSAHSASVSYGGFVNGGRSVITASEDGTVRVWNPRAGTVEHCTNASSPQEPLAITCIASHPSQAVYVLGIETGAVKLAHAETGAPAEPSASRAAQPQHAQNTEYSIRHARPRPRARSQRWRRFAATAAWPMSDAARPPLRQAARRAERARGVGGVGGLLRLHAAARERGNGRQAVRVGPQHVQPAPHVQARRGRGGGALATRRAARLHVLGLARAPAVGRTLGSLPQRVQRPPRHSALHGGRLPGGGHVPGERIGRSQCARLVRRRLSGAVAAPSAAPAAFFSRLSSVRPRPCRMVSAWRLLLARAHRQRVMGALACGARVMVGPLRDAPSLRMPPCCMLLP